MFSITLRAVHKADGGGLWRMRLELPFYELYRDINQLLASDKIGCSGSECFSKLDEVSRVSHRDFYVQIAR